MSQLSDLTLDPEQRAKYLLQRDATADGNETPIHAATLDGRSQKTDQITDHQYKYVLNFIKKVKK